MPQGRSPYMNLRELADYTRAICADGTLDVPAARKWAIKEKLTVKYRGRHMLVHIDEVEVALSRRQHGRIVAPAKLLASRVVSSDAEVM